MMLTQHPEKVDKNCRRNATGWCQVENLSRRRLFMGVSLQKKFRFYEYDQAEMPSRLDKPTKQGMYRIDTKRRMEFLYRTMQGSSIKGGGEFITSEQSSRKGYPPIVWALAIVALLLGAYILPRAVQALVQGGVGSLIGGVEKGASSAMSGKLPTISPAASTVVTVPTAPVSRPPFAPPEITQTVIHKTSVLDGVTCTGVFNSGTNTVLTFSDGSTADSSLGEVQDVGRRFVRAFGIDKPIPLYHSH